VTKALLTLEDSDHRGCHAGVEPHVADKDHLAENIACDPLSLFGVLGYELLRISLLRSQSC